MQSIKRKTILHFLITGTVLVGGLLLYKYTTSLFLLRTYSLVEFVSSQNVFLFLAYCTGVLGILMLVFRRRYRAILQTIFISALFFLAIGIGGVSAGISSLLLYYLVTAYAEEYLKYNARFTLFQDLSADFKDTILLCILIGLGFSFVENILYLVMAIIDNNNINLISFMLGRGLISALLHVVATSAIGGFHLLLSRKIHRIASLIIGLLIGVGLHSAYNVSLVYNLKYLTIPLVIVLFVLLSYLLFRSDRLYAKEADETQTKIPGESL